MSKGVIVANVPFPNRTNLFKDIQTGSTNNPACKKIQFSHIENGSQRKTIEKRSSGQLRVVTYNIHKGVVWDYMELGYVERIHELRQNLHRLKVDLIFLQEVQGRHDVHAQQFSQWPKDSQEIFLAQSPVEQVRFEAVYGKNAKYLHGHHGNALLSRYPLQGIENRDVSDHALERRGILYCTVRIQQVTVHCFVVHLGLLAGSRERQLNHLINWIKKRVDKSEPLIIAGDFNDWGNRLSEPLCQQVNVVEVFDSLHSPIKQKTNPTKLQEGGIETDTPKNFFSWGNIRHKHTRKIRTARTFPASVPCFCMDRIYQRGFQVKNVMVPWGRSWARLSDHSPLIADLDLIDKNFIQAS